MQEVIKKEIIRWLDIGIVYMIVHNKWMGPVQCMPRKYGITVVPKKKNDMISMSPVTGWRYCINYRKLNSCTENDHFPMTSME